MTSKAIQSLLIANRGEIACRIIRTAKQMGIRTIAVYSEPDATGLHVQLADEAIALGGASSADSYLVIDKIIAAAKTSGADAIHPGFGFLSENAVFAEALAQANIIFVGPGIEAINVMGDKIESKKLAQTAGVNTVPGHPDALVDADEAHAIAGNIGYPVMLKASAGGGGKGMRIAWNEHEVRDNFISAQNEARSAFGDDRVFVEKYIERPRHIEIQVLADESGNCVYLGERECSIQRRHQKVVEEAPSPFLDEATRQKMGEQAVALAKAVNYRSAGTVEFIVDKNRNFYFLEMNTRLQVEHPVTECITGYDLVEQMIHVAEGRPLPMQQQDVTLTGWSIETRVYAEDPDRQFMPSIGRLTHYLPPVAGTDKHGVTTRVDTGVFEGGDISMYYDPMIAKLVTHAPTRDEAIVAMQTALDAYVIRGVKHNIPFLSALVSHDAFRKGDLTTAFIDEHYPEGFNSESNQNDRQLSLALLLAATAQRTLNEQSAQISGQTTSQTTKQTNDQANDQTTGPLPQHNYVSAYVDREAFAVTFHKATQWSIGDARHALSVDWAPGQRLVTGDFNEEPFVAQIDRDGLHWQITHGGSVITVLILDAHVAPYFDLMPVKVAPDMSRYLLSPMPGLLIRVSVDVGETVEAGQELAVVEAMKMENVLVAARAGVVSQVPRTAGDNLAVDDIIVEFEAT